MEIGFETASNYTNAAEDIQRGVKQMVQNVTREPHTWERYYSATIDHDLKLIPILWGEQQTAWRWNEERTGLELCA